MGVGYSVKDKFKWEDSGNHETESGIVVIVHTCLCIYCKNIAEGCFKWIYAS